MKRAIDFGASVFLLVVLSPVMLVLAIVVRASLGRPILYRQVRPGLEGEPFTLVKFRTMRTSHSDVDGNHSSDEIRLDRVGAFLRRTSLDELPELWNVLKGDMSLVGPRPLLTKYLDRYTAEQARRHDVRPGITGFAQIQGRNSLTWEERFELDVWYVEHRSLRLDLRILAKTVWQVLRRKGISAEGYATMPEFKGQNPP